VKSGRDLDPLVQSEAHLESSDGKGANFPLDLPIFRSMPEMPGFSKNFRKLTIDQLSAPTSVVVQGEPNWTSDRCRSHFSEMRVVRLIQNVVVATQRKLFFWQDASQAGVSNIENGKSQK
jgi:hypothetical protein